MCYVEIFLVLAGVCLLLLAVIFARKYYHTFSFAKFETPYNLSVF